jgi:hypothetical protein
MFLLNVRNSLPHYTASQLRRQIFSRASISERRKLEFLEYRPVLAPPSVVICIAGWLRLSSRAVNESNRYSTGSLGNKRVLVQ